MASRFQIKLSDEERDALSKLCIAEMRDVGDQARYLIRQALFPEKTESTMPGDQERVVQHLPAIEPTNAVFWSQDEEAHVQIPVLAWEVEERFTVRDGKEIESIRYVKGLVPTSIICPADSDPKKKPLDSSLWEVEAMRDHGLIFQGYTVLRDSERVY